MEKKMILKASIALATYNGEKHIKEQLESLINQTVLPYEIVISDDGSTDNTLQIIQSIIDDCKSYPIIFKVLNNTDHGITKNFNNALKNTSGDIIFLCDQDDIWHSNKIERMMDVMEQHNESMVFHTARIILDNGDGTFKVTEEIVKDCTWWTELRNVPIKKIEPQRFLSKLFHGCIALGMCCAIKKDFLEYILPLSNGSNHDNWIEFCAVAENSTLAISDELAYYRIHSTNTCGLEEFSKKKSFYSKLKDCLGYGKRAKSHIINQYVWFNDVYDFLKDKTIIDEKSLNMYLFFAKERLDILSHHKFYALSHLQKAFKKGSYGVFGKGVLYRDMFLVLVHSAMYRRELLNTANKMRRKTSSN